MHHIKKKVPLFLLLALLFHHQARAEWSLSQIARRCTPAVVSIASFDRKGRPLSGGSGFFSSRGGDLVTCRHVLSGCHRAVLRTSEGTEGKILFISKAGPRLDLVVARTSLNHTTPLPLGDSDGLSIGERIMTMGNPPGLPGALSLGKVHHLREMGSFDLIQMTAPVLPGCSGGPVLNARGEVVGISTAFLNLGPDLNFALPVNELATLQPVHLELSRLHKMKARLEAVVHENKVVDVWMRENASQVPAAAKWPTPGTVYFKNGKTLLCDRAWKQGSTIYLLLHGKDFVLGYEQNSIDMEKSFDL